MQFSYSCYPFFMQGLFQAGHGFFDFAGSGGEVDVRFLHVGLHEQAVVERQLRVECDAPGRGEVQFFAFHPLRGRIGRDESAEAGDDDAVVLLEQRFDMPYQFVHAANIRLFFESCAVAGA